MITAKEAREIAKVYDVESEINVVNAKIREAAQKGETMVKYHGNICIEAHRNPIPIHVRQFEASFRERGFRVQYKVEYSSLANLWYEISW